MMADFHFLRPLWLLMIIPLFVVISHIWHTSAQSRSWSEGCDSHLLSSLLISRVKNRQRRYALILLFLSTLFLITSLAGPSWSRLPTPSYHLINPQIYLIDLSQNMQAKDVSPDRLTRAKFILHDVLKQANAGQFALVVYTGEPFVVSPLTDDAETIDALLPSVGPDIMPVKGHRLAEALEQAAQLIIQAGFKKGQITVLTGETPNQEAVEKARRLANQQIYTSILPLVANAELASFFSPFASAGQGQVISLEKAQTILLQQNEGKIDNVYRLNHINALPVWQDEGRLFLIPALCFLIPVFRRGWIERI